MAVYECALCSFLYDEEQEGAPWESLADDWTCPVCGSSKSDFVLVKDKGPAAETTEATDAFQLNAGEDVPGTVRIGLFGVEPSAGEGAVVQLRFRVVEEAATTVSFDRLYANATPLGPVEVQIQTRAPLGMPESISLSQNYPNPFNGETVIRYQIPVASRVNLRVYNILGQEIAQLADGERPEGFHEVRWDGKDRYGRDAPSGSYFYVLRIGGDRLVGKMEMVR